MINYPEDMQPNKSAFVLLPTEHGLMIVNRFDSCVAPDGGTFGVSHGLLQSNAFDAPEMNLMIQLLQLQRQLRGTGVVMIDGGANIGAHSLTAGRAMRGWGSVLAFEAQETLFYCLAGNIVINNLFNVKAKWQALGMNTTSIEIPVPNYTMPGSFGSLEMIQKPDSEYMGQDPKSFGKQTVPCVTLDSLNLTRCDFLKLDVEGMEEQVLFGSTHLINKCKPIIHVENLKANKGKLHTILENFGYKVKQIGPNSLAIHKDDPALQHIEFT